MPGGIYWRDNNEGERSHNIYANALRYSDNAIGAYEHNNGLEKKRKGEKGKEKKTAGGGKKVYLGVGTMHRGLSKERANASSVCGIHTISDG